MTKPSVSDHALLRYLERVRGFTFEREREEIASTCRGVETGTVKWRGHLYEVREGRVVTITPDVGHPNKTKRIEILGHVDARS